MCLSITGPIIDCPERRPCSLKVLRTMLISNKTNDDYVKVFIPGEKCQFPGKSRPDNSRNETLTQTDRQEARQTGRQA